MVKKNAAGNSLQKAVSCPPELIGGPVSKWGVAKLHMKLKLVRTAGRIGRHASFISDDSPKKYTDGNPVVLVGPVIGLVTETTARILLEVDRNATVEMSLLKSEDSSISESLMASVSHQLWRLTSSPAWFRCAHLEGTEFVNTESAGTKENSGQSQENSSIRRGDSVDTGTSESSRKSSKSSMQRALSDSVSEATSGKGSQGVSGDVSTASGEFAMEKRGKAASAASKAAEPLRRRYAGPLVKLWRRSSLSPNLSKQSMFYFEQGCGGEVNTFTIAREMVAKRPCIFEFTNLKPGFLYKVKVNGCHDAEHGSFKTFPDKTLESFRMASISCNSIFITKTTITPIDDLWSHLFKSLHQINLLIHLGDQIYGDGDRNLDAGAGKDRNKWSNRFKIAEEMLKGLQEGEWESKREEICEKYREVYRDTWKYPSTAKCLANCPNLMIYDDHEVRDNWGDNCLDRRKDCLEFFIARCAWTVTLEYQRQLYEDVDFSNLEAIEKDHHFHVIGKIGLMFLDIRGSRTFHRVENDKTPYLGSKQWEDIEQALADGGLFNRVKVLVVCSPAPLVFLVPAITRAAPHIVDRLEDFKGHWSAYKPEQKMMIDCLSVWKESRQGREVIVLGGDVHCGGHSCILKSGEILFYQLTTSPIANMPLPKTVYYAMRFAEQLEYIQEEFRFRHFNWTRARNYGLVHVNFRGEEDDGERPEIVTQLVRGKFLRPVRMGKRVSNLEEHTCTVCGSMTPIEWCKTRMFNAAVRTFERTLLSGSSRRHETVGKADNDSCKNVE